MNIFNLVDDILDALLGPQKDQQVPSQRSASVQVPENGRRCYYWEERGWKKTGNEYRGYYKGAFPAVEGKITVSPGQSVDVYCRGLPKQIQAHPSWPCFYSREDGWYWIHWNDPPPSVSAAVLGVERILTEACS
jgi:hypothetical protein